MAANSKERHYEQHKRQKNGNTNDINDKEQQYERQKRQNVQQIMFKKKMK